MSANDIDNLYKIEKGNNANLNVAEIVKWEAILGSRDDRVSGNGKYYASQLLEQRQKIELFCELSNSDHYIVSENAVICLINIANEDKVVQNFNRVGFTGVFDMLKLTKDRLTIVKFFVNILNNPNIHDRFISDGGLGAASLLVVDTDKEVSTYAMMIYRNMVANRTDFGVFANAETLDSINLLLQSPSTDQGLVNTLLMVLSNIIQNVSNLQLFYENDLLTTIKAIFRMNWINSDKIREAVMKFFSILLNKSETVEFIDPETLHEIIKSLDGNQNDDIKAAALGAVINLSSKYGKTDTIEEDIKTSQMLSNMASLLSSKNEEVVRRCTIAIANMMINEGLQENFEQVGGIKAVMQVAKSNLSDEIKIKSLKAIFHLSMFSDNLRINLCDQSLNDMTQIIQTTNNPEIKSEIARSMYNMSLSDENEDKFIETKTIGPLLELLLDERNSEVQGLACNILENLAANTKSNEEIRQRGGVQCSLDLLANTKNISLQEKAAMLISKMSVNSKARKELQETNALEILQRLSSGSRNADLKRAVSMATNNVNVPHYENENPELEIETEEIEKFSGFDLGDDNDSDDVFFDSFMDYAYSDSDSDIYFGNDNIDDEDFWDDYKPKPTEVKPPIIEKPIITTPPPPPQKPVGRRSTSVGTANEKKPLPPPPVRPVSTMVTPVVLNNFEENLGLNVDDFVISETTTTGTKKKKRNIFAKFFHSVGKKKKKTGENTDILISVDDSDPVNRTQLQKRTTPPPSIRRKPKESVSRAVDALSIHVPTGSNTAENQDYTVPQPLPPFKKKPVPPPPSNNTNITNSNNIEKIEIVKQSRDIRRKKKALPPPPQDADPAELAAAKMNFMRTKLAQELLQTEASYVKNLSILIKKFEKPLLQLIQANKPILEIQDIRALFSSVDVIYGYNLMLLEGLNTKLAHWSSKQVLGDVFLFMGEFLKAYSDYINNYNNAQQTLAIKLNENKSFTKWLRRTESDPVCNFQNLLSFLIMPVQRVPRYNMLLKELAKNTPENHPDSETLKQALSKVEEIADYLNEKKRESEHTYKLLEITENLVGNVQSVFQPHRVYIGEIPIGFSSPATKLKVVPGVAFIFNDSILITRRVKKNRLLIEEIVSHYHIRKNSKWEGEEWVIFFSGIKRTLSFRDEPSINDFKQIMEDTLERYRQQRETLSYKFN